MTIYFKFFQIHPSFGKNIVRKSVLEFLQMVESEDFDIKIHDKNLFYGSSMVKKLWKSWLWGPVFKC